MITLSRFVSLSLLILGIFVGAVCLTGCLPEQPPIEQTSVVVAVPPVETTETRFEIVMLTEFYDDLAYRGKRRIYEITDRKTGKTYLGVTGMNLEQKMVDDAND